MNLKFEKTYDFDDVLIKPVPSKVSSRNDVDISVKLSENLILKFPLIASPMVGVVNARFAHTLSELGGLAILHRFYKTREDLVSDIKKYLWHSDNFGISLKIGEENIDEIIYQFEPNILLVDTANGYIKKLAEYCEKLKKFIVDNKLNILLMAGNVATPEGCENLYNAGCDLIRVGIGSGGVCSTRNVTGIGVPNISTLMECSALANGRYKIVMDGGIKNSGDFVKSIVAGADLGMAGTLFAECYEAPNEGILYGMASETHMENMKSEIKSVEGFDIPIVKKHSLATFVTRFGYGIKSAGTYLNACSLDEIYINGNFIEVSDSAIKKGL